MEYIQGSALSEVSGTLWGFWNITLLDKGKKLHKRITYKYQEREFIGTSTLKILNVSWFQVWLDPGTMISLRSYLSLSLISVFLQWSLCPEKSLSL